MAVTFQYRAATEDVARLANHWIDSWDARIGHHRGDYSSPRYGLIRAGHRDDTETGLQALSRRSGLHPRTLYRILRTETTWTSLWVADQILVAIDRVDALNTGEVRTNE